LIRRDDRAEHPVLPCALRDCGVRLPESDVTAAGIVLTQLARKHLEGIAGEDRVIRTVGAVLAWCGYPESIMDLPLGHLLPIEDEWDENRCQTREELAEVVRDACKEQLAKDSDHT
jgi:hypothetical protein